MTVATKKQLILEKIVELLELPDFAYEKARKRYDDLGQWLVRDDSTVKDNDPHIFPQGSFRLGTAIKPLNKNEEYDLDLVCKLRVGITERSHTQEDLKRLVRYEIESYRIARKIKAPIKEKHRCWCLEYQDDISFHIDIVPCIPASDSRRTLIFESMQKAGENICIAREVSDLTVSITDDRHHCYRYICDDWNISNPEGYAKWFESRMNQAQYMLLEKAQVDDIPLFKKKTPLQKVIQLLKRHRDKMFKIDENVKPTSIVISTLAARAYQGEADIESALENILDKMRKFINSSRPKVPNPVNPEEDFADRWSMPKYKDLDLEEIFYFWLEEAQNYFYSPDVTNDISFLIN